MTCRTAPGKVQCVGLSHPEIIAALAPAQAGQMIVTLAGVHSARQAPPT